MSLKIILQLAVVFIGRMFLPTVNLHAWSKDSSKITVIQMLHLHHFAAPAAGAITTCNIL